MNSPRIGLASSAGICYAGISSYAYRYHIGTEEFTPDPPMSVHGFLREAARLGFGGVLLCENLSFAKLDRDGLLEVRAEALRLGLCIEIGMRTLSEENLDMHLHMAGILSSRFLRIVLGPGGTVPEASLEKLSQTSIAILKKALPNLEKDGVTIGIENHFDLPTSWLAHIVDEVGSPRVGMVFDTTNGLGFMEKPEETLETIGKRLLSVHIKDFLFQKAEAGYLMSGTVLGEGLLDLDGLLRRILQLNPLASLILEMTMRRPGAMEERQILQWETEAVEKSARRLQQALDLIFREDAKS